MNIHIDEENIHLLLYKYAKTLVVFDAQSKTFFNYQIKYFNLPIRGQKR